MYLIHVVVWSRSRLGLLDWYGSLILTQIGLTWLVL